MVVKGLNIANPQLTPLKNEVPPWMQLGFDLFSTLSDIEYLYEVFPSASYALLKGQEHPKVSISFTNFADSPKICLTHASALSQYMNSSMDEAHWPEEGLVISR